MTQEFIVYDASAGSGKTYTIVKEYLKIVLASDDVEEFKHILAITFTNKAADEMKSRVLEALLDLSIGNPNSQNLLEELSLLLKLDPKILMKRSKSISKAILHDYSNLSIFTIDKFTNRLIRTFAHDMGLPVNFDVELNVNVYLEEAVDSLISKIGEDQTLSKILIDFALRKFADGKSWNLKYDLSNISKELFQESSFGIIENLKKVDSSRLYSFIDETNSLYFDLRSQYRELGQRGLLLLDRINLPAKAFYQSAFPNFINDLNNDAEIWDKKYKYLEDCLNNEHFYSKSQKDNAIRETLDSFYTELSDIYLRYKSWSKENMKQFVLLHVIRQNVESMAVLNEIEKELSELKENNNILFNAEFNKKISDEISKEEVPYIYERIGNKYKYIFIDEFQDTSILQWKNLIPLVENAYAVGGKIILVGDGKQAIYRWRSGDVGQFLELRNNKYPGLNTEKANPPLDTNWRSAREIVDFNNKFFNYVANNFDSELGFDYMKIYQEGSKQKSVKDFTGYIELRLDQTKPSDFDIDQDAANYTLTTINSLLEEGYELGDICLITRKNSELSKLTNFLIDKDLKVVSKESLLLQNVPEIAFCINYIKSYNSKDDFLSRFKLLEYLLENGFIDDDRVNFNKYFSQIAGNKETFEDVILKMGVELDFNILKQNSLYDSFEVIIRKFKLHEKANFELQFFLDFVHEFSVSKKGDLNMFIQHWNDHESDLSLIIPEGINAIKAMTIHKSKGLEFKIVIMPYGSINLEQKTDNLWVDIEGDLKNSKLKHAYVSNSEKLKFFSKGIDVRTKEAEDSKLDVYNTVYVAFTRAIQRLYVNLPLKSRGVNLRKNVEEFLKTESASDCVINDSTYSFGRKVLYDKKEKNAKIIEPTVRGFEGNWKDKLQVSNESKGYWEIGKLSDREFGNLVHNVLAQLVYSDQLDDVLQKFSSEGLIDNNSMGKIENYLRKITQSKELEEYFSSNYKVFNENDLIFESRILRPDRVVVKGNEATIIDYKSGLRKPEHDNQINDYKKAISSLGYSVKEGILIYLNEELNIVRV